MKEKTRRHGATFALYLSSFCIATAFSSLPAHAKDSVRLPEWNRLQYGSHELGFHGYLRTTKGFDSKGGDIMPMFIAPGAQSKYRLGNESDTNLEVALDYRYNLDRFSYENSRFIQLYGMISDYDVNPHYGDVEIQFEELSNPQAYVRFGNFLGQGTHVWLGRRYYDRRDIHMMDHFWLNVGQGAEFGGGIEGIPLGVGSLDVAAFHNEDDSVSDRLGGSASENIDTYTLDLRYRGIPTWENGDLTLWGFYAHRPEQDDINFDQNGGLGFGGWHTQKEVMGGRMVTGFAVRQGAAMQQGLFNSKSIREDQGFDLDEAYSVELNNDLLIEPNDHYAMQWATVLRTEVRGEDGVSGDRINWISTGARPVFYLNDHFSIATEIGVDYVDNEIIGEDGFLGKGTIALQLTEKKGYFERPMVKLFMTGAAWSDNFEGRIANGNPAKSDSFADETSGVTFGIQFESWW